MTAKGTAGRFQQSYSVTGLCVICFATKTERVRERERQDINITAPEVCPWLSSSFTCYEQFLKSASHASARPTIPVFGHNSGVKLLFMSFAWLDIFSSILQNKPYLFRFECMPWFGVWATEIAQIVFSLQIAIKQILQRNLVHLNICSSVISDHESSTVEEITGYMYYYTVYIQYYTHALLLVNHN